MRTFLLTVISSQAVVRSVIEEGDVMLQIKSSALAENVQDDVRKPKCIRIARQIHPVNNGGFEPETAHSTEECQRACYNKDGCEVFTFFMKSKACHFASKSGTRQMHSPHAVWGPRECVPSRHIFPMPSTIPTLANGNVISFWTKFALKGSDQCPSGSLPLDELDCHGYASRVASDLLQGSATRLYPKGCSKYGQTVLFNTDAMGKPSQTFQVVCKYFKLPTRKDVPVVTRQVTASLDGHSGTGKVGTDASGNVFGYFEGSESYLDVEEGQLYFNGEVIDLLNSSVSVNVAMINSTLNQMDVIVVEDHDRVEAEVANSSTGMTALIGGNHLDGEVGDVEETGAKSVMSFNSGGTSLVQRESFEPASIALVVGIFAALVAAVALFLTMAYAIFSIIIKLFMGCNPRWPWERPCSLLQRGMSHVAHGQNGSLQGSMSNVVDSKTKMMFEIAAAELVFRICNHINCAAAGSELSHLITSSK